MLEGFDGGSDNFWRRPPDIEALPEFLLYFWIVSNDSCAGNHNLIFRTSAKGHTDLQKQSDDVGTCRGFDITIQHCCVIICDEFVNVLKQRLIWLVRKCLAIEPILFSQEQRHYCQLLQLSVPTGRFQAECIQERRYSGICERVGVIIGGLVRKAV